MHGPIMYNNGEVVIGPDSDSDDIDSDEDITSETENIYAQRRTPVKENTPLWNRFRPAPKNLDSYSKVNAKRRQHALNVIKAVSCGLVFVAILGGGCIAKTTLVLMTSQIKIRKRSYCYGQDDEEPKKDVNLSNEERAAWMWTLVFAFILPEVLALLRSLRMWLFKFGMRPKVPDLLIVIVLESASLTGIALLVFIVLPEMNAIKAVMITNCVCLVPAILGFICRLKEQKRRMWRLILDVVAIVFQISGLVVWVILDPSSNSWCLPVALLLTSCSWWENFIKECVDRTFQRDVQNGKKSLMRTWMPGYTSERSLVSSDDYDGFYTKLGKLKYRIRKSRYAIYSFVSLWKIALFFSEFLIFTKYINNEDLSTIFAPFKTIFGAHNLSLSEIGKPESLDYYFEEASKTSGSIKSWKFTPLFVLLVHCACGWICYFGAKFTVKVRIQRFCYAIPVALVVPCTMGFLIGVCIFKGKSCSNFNNFMPKYLFWTCPFVSEGENFAEEFFIDEAGFIWIFWLLSQLWITQHLWFPHLERLASTDRIFVTPMYSSFLIDQSLSMNRARDDAMEIPYREDQLSETDPEGATPTTQPHPNRNAYTETNMSDRVTRIYACATMWHETKDEMLEMLKSLCRMDLHQATKRMAREYFGVMDDDYYEFEANIFFDDAFTGDKDVNETRKYVVNQYVQDFMVVINECIGHIYPKQVGGLKPPKKYPTPYGGRLEYRLPGKTKLYVHLKNKNMIRHKKRWSQVMYMYYLLGLRLMGLSIARERKEVIAENTYVLALDGDIDFQPKAVHYLIDLMKKDDRLGAACGRIHPTGKGPMVWYQMFEYAIGHWLQKATEHVIGCVLCSPGCFSLFRAKALMDDGVMNQYTKVSEKPRHHVQYDQGEDRWLCTLLLQRGYRVEYGAAADSYTHAPTGFREFFNQRRRWIPSTMANIMDVLQNAKNTVKRNDNISWPYIMYQMMMMTGTVLGPGTIFLMMIGAFNSAFGISMYASLALNLVPMILFMMICMLCKSNIQLFFCEVLSAIYALVMMAVIVGIAIQMTEDGLQSPTSIMFLAVLSSFVVTALMHPLEIKCLFPFIIYYLLTPSMYLLLIIYALFNLNDVSWGTREGGSSKAATQTPTEKNALQQQLTNSKEEDSGIDFSCAGLFRIQCCTHKKPDQAEENRKIMEALQLVITKVEDVEKHQLISDCRKNRRGSAMTSRRGSVIPSKLIRTVSIHDSSDESSDITSNYVDTDGEECPRIREPVRNHLVNPYWLDHPSMTSGNVDFLDDSEIVFWEDLIKDYLKPLDKDSKKEEDMANQLKDLRNKMAFFFIMLNSLFVLIIFLLQMNNDKLYVQWPLGVKSNFTYDPKNEAIYIENEYLQMEPIGLTFVFFFGLILVIQVVCMFIHRWSTIETILAVATFSCCTPKGKFDEENEGLIELMNDITHMPSLNTIDTDRGTVARRRTIHALTKEESRHKGVKTVDAVVRQRLRHLDSIGAGRQASIRQSSNSIFAGNFNRQQLARQSTLHAAVRRFHTANVERRRRIESLGGANGQSLDESRFRNGSLRRQYTTGNDNPAYCSESDIYADGSEP